MLVLYNQEVSALKSFTVNFHQEDNAKATTVHKLSEEDFNKATEKGTRHLFDLDTNVGFFVFFDAEDAEGNDQYLMLQYEGDHEEPSACYGFDLKLYYQFLALYLNDLEFQGETNEEEEEYGPIHHLAHLLYHIVEDGKSIEV